MNTCRPIAALFFLCIIVLGGVGEFSVMGWRMCAGCPGEAPAFCNSHLHGSCPDVGTCNLCGKTKGEPDSCCGNSRGEAPEPLPPLPSSFTFRFICPEAAENAAFADEHSSVLLLDSIDSLECWSAPPLEPPPKSAHSSR